MATIGMQNSRDTDKKIGAYAYVATPAVTTVTAAGTYYPILGTFTNTHLEQFSAAGTAENPSIQYDGAATLDMEIDWHATISSDHAGSHVALAIKKNTDLVAASVMATTLKTTSDEYALSGTCVVSVAPGDKIQLVLTSDHEGEAITAQHYTTTIRPFFF